MAVRTGQRWPLDLRAFAIILVFWASYLAAQILFRDSVREFIDPIETVFAGMKFHGDGARAVLLSESLGFWTAAVGILTARRWGLVLALFFMVEIVLSHLIFVIAYLNDRDASAQVRMAAIEGPSLVIVALYLWIRSKDLIFGRPGGA
ncbi:MAG TPA: hypothetical protein VEC38_06635 [Candidatus Binataceae bacterium]|nr:hypothetical protein [Candidatus Binataceae bacterium]